MPRDERGLEHDQLRDDIAVAREYGGRHPADWAGVWFENEPTVRVAVAFCANVASHEAALRQLVSYPERLEVRSLPHSVLELQGVRAEVDEIARTSPTGAFKSWGNRIGRVNIMLRADQEPLAAELRQRFGDMVDIRLGFLTFPRRGFEFPGGRRRLMSASSPLPILDPDRATVAVPEGLEVASGADLLTELYVHNVGPEELVILTGGQVMARVIDPTTGDAVGGFTGAQAAMLVSFRIAPGDRFSIPLLVGTGSTNPELGYAVPPGSWSIEVPLSFENGEAVRTPPFPLTVIPMDRT